MANKSLTMRQTPSALKKTPTDYETKLRKRQTGLGSPKYPRITALSPSHFRVIEFWDLCDDSTALRLSSLASLYFESHETFLHSLRKGGLLITLFILSHETFLHSLRKGGLLITLFISAFPAKRGTTDHAQMSIQEFPYIAGIHHHLVLTKKMPRTYNYQLLCE